MMLLLLLLLRLIVIRRAGELQIERSLLLKPMVILVRPLLLIAADGGRFVASVKPWNTPHIDIKICRCWRRR